MAKDSILQVRMDSHTKEQAEILYHSLGTSLAEAVRIFAAQSIIEGGFPFQPMKNKTAFGILSGYSNTEQIPDERNAFEQTIIKKHDNP